MEGNGKRGKKKKPNHNLECEIHSISTTALHLSRSLSLACLSVPELTWAEILRCSIDTKSVVKQKGSRSKRRLMIWLFFFAQALECVTTKTRRS